MKTADIMYVVCREISDARGTSEPVGVYNSSKAADHAMSEITDRRSFVMMFDMNAPPKRKRS